MNASEVTHMNAASDVTHVNVSRVFMEVIDGASIPLPTHTYAHICNFPLTPIRNLHPLVFNKDAFHVLCFLVSGWAGRKGVGRDDVVCVLLA